jgi:hypothetical protein
MCVGILTIKFINMYHFIESLALLVEEYLLSIFYVFHSRFLQFHLMCFTRTLLVQIKQCLLLFRYLFRESFIVLLKNVCLCQN